MAVKGFYDRRSGRDRRDWDIFVYPDRRTGIERRSGLDRRQSDGPYDGPERRKKVEPGGEEKQGETPRTARAPKPLEDRYYSTAEVARITGLSQTTLLLWLRNKVIDGSRIKRSVEGRRLWTREDIEEIERVKAKNGWTV